MMKKISAIVLGAIMSVSMIPAFAFAAENDNLNNSEMLLQEITTLQEDAKIRARDFLKDGKFCDDGTPYLMEDTSGYAKSMRIYAFYLGTGEYGDAVLIESDGKYLLMDTGHKDSSSRLVSCLQKIGVKKLDVYISHMHGDHTGGLEAVCAKFKVKKVFFPDIEVCEKYETPKTNKTIDKIYAEHVAVAKNEKADVIYLRPSSKYRTTAPRAANTTNKFNVGGAVCTVMGPLGRYTIDGFEKYVKELNGSCGTKEGHYLNNSSLCTMVKCGKIKYLATGDIEKQEEKKLADKYGNSLNCDVEKLPHHSLRTSNTDTFASKTTAMWSFEQNHGFLNAYKSAINVALKYGYNYAVATQKHGAIITVDNNAVCFFRDNNDNMLADDGMLNGWVKSGSNYQYYNSSGHISTGWKWLGGYLYYMDGQSGFRYTGTHKINGTKVKFSSAGKLTSHKKPARVSMLSAKAKAGHKITVKWDKTARAGKYQIYRAAGENEKFIQIAAVKKSRQSFTDSRLAAGQEYYYKVRATRKVAGGTMYGSFSKVWSAKAK